MGLEEPITLVPRRPPRKHARSATVQDSTDEEGTADGGMDLMRASAACGGTFASVPAPAGDREGGGLADILLAVETRLAGLIHARFDASVEPRISLAALVRAEVKGEIKAYKSRQPSADALSDAAT